MKNYFADLTSEIQIKIFISIPLWKRKPLLFKSNNIVEFYENEKYSLLIKLYITLSINSKIKNLEKKKWISN